jgi:succinyl-CoA synthetase alpha subunit
VGVTPGKGGTAHELARFNSVHDTVRELAPTPPIFVPPPFAADAIMERTRPSAAVCITEGIPTLDMLKVTSFMNGKATQLTGPAARRHHLGPGQGRHRPTSARRAASASCRKAAR